MQPEGFPALSTRFSGCYTLSNCIQGCKCGEMQKNREKVEECGEMQRNEGKGGVIMLLTPSPTIRSPSALHSTLQPPFAEALLCRDLLCGDTYSTETLLCRGTTLEIPNLQRHCSAETLLCCVHTLQRHYSAKTLLYSVHTLCSHYSAEYTLYTSPFIVLRHFSAEYPSSTLHSSPTPLPHDGFTQHFQDLFLTPFRTSGKVSRLYV